MGKSVTGYPKKCAKKQHELCKHIGDHHKLEEKVAGLKNQLASLPITIHLTMNS
jgi:hypothetical protein